jgi:hypothetical protein
VQPAKNEIVKQLRGCEFGPSTLPQRLFDVQGLGDIEVTACCDPGRPQSLSLIVIEQRRTI